jgi:SAM-dependent methyltransferase
MLAQTLKALSYGLRGVEIGGPSGSGRILYASAATIDNVIFSKNTVWSTHNDHYNYFPGKTGKVIINDAVHLADIPTESYDFLFSSHSLEHIANPLKAVGEWLRVVKNRGYVVIIVPEKSICFDHKRSYSKFATLLSQYKKNVGEDDLSTLPEILANHDLAMDPAAGNLEQFTRRSLDNINNRCLHHYVYDDNLLEEICTFFKAHSVYKETHGLNRWFIMQKTT